MRKLPIVLFFLGFLIQFGALVGEHTAEIPSVLKIIAPKYSRAHSGIETLMRQRTLRNTNEGFEEISRVLIGYMWEMNGRTKNQLSDEKVTRLDSMGETLQIGTTRGDVAYGPDDIRFELTTVTNGFIDSSGKISKSMQFQYHMSDLQREVDELKNPNILTYCFGLFIVGSVIEIIAFFMEASGDHKSDPAQSSEASEEEHPPAVTT